MNDLYIKMCECSVKLQEAWKPKFGDKTTTGIITSSFSYDFETLKLKEVFLRSRCLDDNGLGFRESSTEPFLADISDLVWLPRQEDLQELLDYPTHGCMLQDFIEFADGYNIRKVKSLSMLWLLFVHKELWNQEWDFKKEEWVRPRMAQQIPKPNPKLLKVAKKNSSKQ